MAMQGARKSPSGRSARAAASNPAGARASRPKESVSVEIQGKSLSLRTNHEPAFVRELAAYIDDKLGALQRAAPGAPFDKLMMLVSLTVAEELFSARADLDTMRHEVDARVQSMLAMLDATEDELQHDETLAIDAD